MLIDPVLGLRRQAKRAMSIKGIHDAFAEVIVVHAEATTNGHTIGFRSDELASTPPS